MSDRPADDPPLEQWADTLEQRLAGKRLVRVYRETGSTQDVVKQLAANQNETADGALVVTEHQTAGRGRLGRTWHSSSGAALTFSVAYRVDRSSLDRVTFAASVALAQVLDVWLAPVYLQTKIKWPNDIYVDGKKIAGILVEAVGGFAFVGVGLNIGDMDATLPEDVRQRATSLSAHGIGASRLDVLVAVVQGLDRTLKTTPEEELLAAWRTKCGMLHQDVCLGHGGETIEGRVIDLDPHDGLVVRRSSGEIIHLPAATTTVL